MKASKELFYVVDEMDNVIGKATREECHSDAKLIHRSVYIFVINDNGKVFLQKRSVTKDLYPGCMTGSATGHVDYGESYNRAARRELKEELGIDAPLQRLGRVKSFSEREREISTLYLCHYNGPINPNKNEIDEGFFSDVEDIKTRLKKGEDEFAEGFKTAFQELLKYIECTR